MCDSVLLQAVLVPQIRLRGQNASLLCKYELEPNEELFSLKWYKEDTEFYRYTPPERSASQRHQRYQQQQQWSDGYGNNNNNNRRRGHHHGEVQVPQPIQGNVQSWPVPGIKLNVSSTNKQLTVQWHQGRVGGS